MLPAHKFFETAFDVLALVNRKTSIVYPKRLIY